MCSSDPHAQGRTLAELHDGVVVPVQREVGRMWLMAEIPIADEHFASQVVRTCLDRLAASAARGPRRGRKGRARTSYPNPTANPPPPQTLGRSTEETLRYFAVLSRAARGRSRIM